jgi:hypothetical protein
MQPFSTIETTLFQKIFEDIPGIDLLFQSATTYKRYIRKEFVKYRSIIKQELAETCQTIALSLDAWTSKNQLSIIIIIGHWLMLRNSGRGRRCRALIQLQSNRIKEQVIYSLTIAHSNYNLP